jgi:hypothetical protein
MAIKTRATSNFSFRKLADAFDEVFDDFLEKDFAEDAIKSAKEIIKGGKTRELLPSTIKRRRRRGTGGTTPLYETGNLYRSLKKVKGGIEMANYGIHHQKGFRVGKTKVPPRRFISGEGLMSAKTMENLIKKINKAWRV